MHESLRYLLEKILIKYSEKDFYDQLLAAKEFYFQKTGKVFEEDADYESRMAAFNDWYVLDYIDDSREKSFFELYCSENSPMPEIVTSIRETNHSLYEYTGTSFKGLHLLKDILHDQKITLAKNHPTPSLLKGDIFIGRTVKYLDEVYLYNGLRMMPSDSASILKKEAKKVRKAIKKLQEPSDEKRKQSEEKFLFLIESHKTKWQHYGHVDISKIFIFPKEVLA